MSRPTKEEILTALEAAAETAFGGGLLAGHLRLGRRQATARVMVTFGQIGKRFGFLVGAKRCLDAAFPEWEADYPEWLYDMTWTEMKGDWLLSMPVAIESEWKYHYAIVDQHRVDHDFQKLVQARADVRVWVSSAPNEEIARKHVEACQQQACMYAGAQAGDTYLFVVNVWSAGSTSIQRFEVEADRPSRTPA